MPRARKAPLFELAGQWIAREPGSPFFHRYWTEPGSGRTRRASLRTTDLEEAKRQLAEIVVKGAPKSVSTPLSAVLLAYFEERTDKLRSREHARLAGRTLLACWGATVRVESITEARQKEFALWSIVKGHSLAYISRNLSVLSAALRHSKLDHEIIFGMGKMVERWGLQTKAPRRAFVPTDDELATLLSLDLAEDFRRWLIVSLLTGARPEAVLELSAAQRVKDAGLLDLNPPGRRQNKKFRPTVREPRALTAWLDHWEGMSLFSPTKEAGKLNTAPYCSYATKEALKSAFERARAKIGLPRLTARSIRHKVATVLRKARIPEDEIALQLGHRRQQVRTTAGYGEWDPDYLAGVADALDAWWIKLGAKVSKPLFPPAAPAANVKELRRA